MTSGDFMVPVFEKLYSLEKAIYNLTLSNVALICAMREKLPAADYEKHLRIATRSEQAKGMLEMLRIDAEQLEKLRAAKRE